MYDGSGNYDAPCLGRSARRTGRGSSRSNGCPQHSGRTNHGDNKGQAFGAAVAKGIRVKTPREKNENEKHKTLQWAGEVPPLPPMHFKRKGFIAQDVFEEAPPERSWADILQTKGDVEAGKLFETLIAEFSIRGEGKGKKRTNQHQMAV